MDQPHPKLAPLLSKHNVTHADFIKKGRPVKGTGEALVNARRAIITELHAQGTSWAEMLEVTGLGQGSIQRLTGAMWNSESRKRVSENGVRTGKLWKGKPRPGQLERQWAAGTFDFHRGRDRTPEEVDRQKASYTPEVRAKMSEKKVDFLAQNPGWSSFKYAQTEEWVTVKGGTFKVRSSYESAAVRRLEGDDTVHSFIFEPRLLLPDGKYILPDFLVTGKDGTLTLVEVKPACFAFGPRAQSATLRRLQTARTESERNKWNFSIWTEVELKTWLIPVRRNARKSAPHSPADDSSSDP
jgi:hypothetical protein